MSIAEKLITIAENEQRVYDAGYEKGKAEGGDTDAAFEAGRQAEKQDFWDKYQNNSNPTYCKYQFAGKGWDYNTFYPKYDITPKVAQNMFQEFGRNVFFSLTERLNECKVTFDTSQCTQFHYIFYGTPFTEVPHIDTTNSTSLQNVYANSNQLIKASMSIKEDGSQTWTSCFTSCSKLADFTITSGAIGKNGFDIHWSTKLSKASILSILNACNKANAGVTITLPSKCIDGATDTKTLLENDKNAFEHSVSWDTSSTIQLPNTNIKKSSVVLTTYYADGEEAPNKSYDDGEGNIRFSSPTGSIQGTIDYDTGLINLTSWLDIAQGGQIKVDYETKTPYQNALANGYTIAYA